MKRDEIRHILTRAALALLFISFGIWEILQPQYWVAFLPSFLNGLDPNLLIMVHGTVLLLVGLAVMTGAYLRIASIIYALIMLEIVGDLIVTSGFSDLVIRDIVVLVFAIALYFDDTKYMRLTNG
ncbi:MAG: hypothetical protein M1504_00245 [Candidatus Marsarchaeota archaeon]|nr:hypothetical protein [Candidatus Marsarchaeota archaeon]